MSQQITLKLAWREQAVQKRMRVRKKLKIRFAAPGRTHSISKQMNPPTLVAECLHASMVFLRILGLAVFAREASLAEYRSKKDGSVRNTIEHLRQNIREAAEFAKEVRSAPRYLPSFDEHFNLIVREFGESRFCLQKHTELTPAEYAYIMVETFVGEVPAHLAVLEARLREFLRELPSDTAWQKLQAARIAKVNEMASEARTHLEDTRKRLGKFWWRYLLLELAIRRLLLNPETIPKQGARRRRRFPLGYGDLHFRISCAAAAASHYSDIDRFAWFSFAADVDDDKFVNDFNRSLDACREFLIRAREGNFMQPPPRGTLSIGAGLALTQMESLIGRQRLSSHAMLCRSKTYLLRAAACLAHAISAVRSRDPACLVVPESKRGSEEEKRLAMTMASRHLEAAKGQAQTPRLWRYDWLLKMEGYPTRVVGIDVLPDVDRPQLLTLINRFQVILNNAAPEANQ